MIMHAFARFALLFALAILLQTCEACEVTSDYERIPALLNGCFLLSKHKASWEEATLACQKRGGHLIHIYYNDYMALAVSSLNKTKEHTIWIGMRKTDQDWTWSVDGSSVGTSTWVPGQPASTASNQCAMMSSNDEFKWTSNACSTDNAGYICTHRNGTEGCVSSGGQLKFASSVSGLCYIVYQNPVSWYAARQRCKGESAPLAKVDSKSVFELLQSQLDEEHERNKPDIDGYWIGLRNSVWKWDRGTEVLESFWDRGCPSSSFDCGAVRSVGSSIGWDAYDCTKKFHYICDAPNRAPTTTGDPTVTTPAKSGGPSPALTGGLVVLCLVLLLILGAIVALFFLYKRRGSQLRARARAAAAAMRSAPPPREKAHNGDPSNLFFVQNNGAAAYDGDFNDIEPTSDKARIVEHPQGMAISQTKQKSSYESIEEDGNSTSLDTALKDTQNTGKKEIEETDRNNHVIPKIHIEDSGSSSAEPDKTHNDTEYCQTDKGSEQAGLPTTIEAGSEVSTKEKVDEEFPSTGQEATPQISPSPTSDNENKINITHNEAEVLENIGLSQASLSNPSSSDENKCDDVMSNESNSKTQLQVDPGSKNLLTVSDKLDMEEFDENELLSPRFKDDLVPPSTPHEIEQPSQSDDIGLMELDPSDIMTPRGMPMGKTLQPTKHNDDFIDL